MMDFKQAEERFKQLKARFTVGTLNENEFKAQLEKLMIQDEQGAWWMIGYETERWYRHDGTEWVQTNPPTSQSQKSKLEASVEPESVESKNADAARREKAEREEAERLAREKAERDAAEKAAREKVTREAEEKKAREKAERVTVEKAAREKAIREFEAREAAERAARARNQVYQQPATHYTPAVQPSKPKSRSWIAYGAIAIGAIAFCSAVGIWVFSTLFNPPATPAPEEPAPAEPAATEAPAPAEFEGKSLVAPDCDYGGFFKSIEATDASTVTFSFCKPDPAFLSKIAWGPFAIYPEEWIEATAGEENRTSEGLYMPIGTGPYMLDEWNFDESITFAKNHDYWGETPLAADTLVFRWSNEDAVRLLSLQAGEIDGFDDVGPDDFATIESDPNLQLVMRPPMNIFYIGMTNTFRPFDDYRVRQAIAMGIDRQRIVNYFYPRGSQVASHFTPCAIPNGCVGESWYDFDPDRARMLLAEAGYPDGFSTKLYYRDVFRGYLPYPGSVAEDIQAQLWNNLNIYVEIVVMESGAFIEESGAGRLDGLYLLGWGADYPHVTNFLNYHFGKDNPQFGTPHPEIYDYLVTGSQFGFPAEAEQYYVEANNAIKELVPVVPVARSGSAVAYGADVENPQASPLTSEVFAYSKPGDRDVFVWMQNAEPISLFCADETDGESLRGCEQVMECLYAYEINGADVRPALATDCSPNSDLTIWTCSLRKGVKFHDGSTFDANDVVTTFTMGLDASSPLHVGNTNIWDYYDYLWGIMNKP